MKDLSELSTEEMTKDRDDSIADIAVCEKALSLGIAHHQDGTSVQSRVDVNKKIIMRIDDELSRRKISASPDDLGDEMEVQERAPRHDADFGE